jgi:hypothetical protein
MTLVLLAGIIIVAYTLRLILLIPERRARQVVRPLDAEVPSIESQDSAAANERGGHVALPDAAVPDSSKTELSANQASSRAVVEAP